VRLRVWSPLPPSPSGIADYVAEALPALSAQAEVQCVVESPQAVDPDLRARFAVVAPQDAGAADLDLYHLGNSPGHAYVYRRALTHPGVVVLHEWSLHHLVLHETLEQGHVSAYLHEMRRAHGETGTFVGRQVARALGGDVWPALFPLNDRLLEASLGVVTLTRAVAQRVQRRLPHRPVLPLPHHLALPLDPLPTRQEARRRLGLPADAFVVTAPGLATANKRTETALHALGRLDEPSILVVAGAPDPRLDLRAAAQALGVADRVVFTGRLELADFLRHLFAADAVLCLRFPTHGEMSGALVRALGAGRAAFVTAGTPAALELPPGVAVPIDPGPREEDELVAFLRYLMAHPDRRAALERLAASYAREAHDLPATVTRLVRFLENVAAGRAEAVAQLEAERAPEAGLLGYFMEEIQWGARDLGLVGMRLGLEPLLRELAGEGQP
jgi:glycosyltransferase involved in cell wall biosynthesis